MSKLSIATFAPAGRPAKPPSPSRATVPAAGAVGVGTDAAPQSVRPLKAVRHLRAIYTQEQSDNAIHRERCRADRTGQQFALVLFRIPRSIGPSKSLLRLARNVLTRSRGTDEVGWYDADTVCALLPDTAADGAHRFADNVAAAFRDAAQRPQVTIYTYPGSWLDDVPCEPGRSTTPAVHVTGPATSPSPAGRRSAAELMPFVSRGMTQTLADRGQLPAGQVAVATLDGDTPPLGAEHGIGLSPATAAAAARPLTVLLARPMPWWKRAMDVLGAAAGLVAFAPVFAVAAVAIKLTEPDGPVFFCQRRAGLGGRPFKIVKFRTMCVDAEARKQALRARSEQDGPAFKLKHDPRVTGIGRLLRKTSLDELPQLWNVLRGEMSLVGPRPLPIDEQDGAERWQQTRLDVTPGLTCIWQIKGRSTVTFAEWVRMDVSYIRRRTIWHDVKILAQTVPAVLLRRGAR